MSLVGPRTEIPESMKFYTPDRRALILSMRPGLTDYAATLFRDENSLLEQGRDPVEVYRREIMPAKFTYYERYSREIGLLTDLRIILRRYCCCCRASPAMARRRTPIATIPLLRKSQASTTP
jgi:lipopolysaccharide/colanic/teichoic acid biosynthesis glycosyltransferase